MINSHITHCDVGLVPIFCKYKYKLAHKYVEFAIRNTHNERLGLTHQV